LPRAASGFSVAIAEKSLVNELVEINGTAAELLELLGLLELLELPQAARMRAALLASAVRPALLVTEYNETTSLMGGTCRDMHNCQVHMTATAWAKPVKENSKPLWVNASVNISVTLLTIRKHRRRPVTG
jgi:hypothetical protein